MKYKSLITVMVLAVTMSFGMTALAAAPDGMGPWADTAPSAAQGLKKDGGVIDPARSNPAAVFGIAETTGTPEDSATAPSNFFSLGFGGTLTVGFDNAIINGEGADLAIYEVTGGIYPDEKIKVEASHNGTDWVVLSESAVRDISLDIGILPCAKFVRLTDISDKALFEPAADGYDVDAVKALHNGEVCDAAASIEVEKTADPAEVFPGETVVYSYAVANSGDFDLHEVVLGDDKCAVIAGPAGDDGDGILEVGEVWNYTCSAVLSETTTNIASVSSRDPWNHAVTDTDEFTVAVKEIGCTLTQGYWKNHALGSKHEDDTWELLANASFWLNALKTPVKGNAWYQLAHQYVAAKLNALGGTYVPPEVQTAMTGAETLLGNTPFEVAKNQKAGFINLARILGEYNEGITEVPHCSEI